MIFKRSSFGILSFLPLFAVGMNRIFSQECPPPAPNQRDLIIIADILNTDAIELFGFSAVSDSQPQRLKDVLESQAVPVLVELSTWKRLLKDQASQELIRTFHGEIYQFGNYLLCIPDQWKKEFKIEDTDTGFNLTKGSLVANARALQAGYLEPIKGVVKQTLASIYFHTSLVKVLRVLLKRNYAWNIVIFGHGGGPEGFCSLTIIAGMPYYEFKDLLQFLNTEITTNILLYSACFAGSKWLLTVYMTDGKPDVYRFPIIVTGIAQAPHFYSTNRDVAAMYSFFKEIKTMSLCKESTSALGLSAGILLQALTYDESTKKYRIHSVNNLLQIRWPGSTEFHAIPLQGLVASSKVLLQDATADVQKIKPLIHAARVKSKALIIDTPFINKTLILSGSDHIIASSIPDRWHYIKGILLASEKEEVHEFMSRLFGYFTNVIALESSIIFLIDHVHNIYNPTGVQKAIVFLNTPTPSTYRFQKTSELFYMVGEQGYRIPLQSFEPLTLDPAVTRRYVKLFEYQKKKLLDKYGAQAPL
jgi:hypothetical protein